MCDDDVVEGLVDAPEAGKAYADDHGRRLCGGSGLEAGLGKVDGFVGRFERGSIEVSSVRCVVIAELETASMLYSKVR